MMLLTKENRNNLPELYSQEHVKDPIVWVKFFDPSGSWTWYATEFDGEDIFFGLVSGIDKELGYFSLKELESVRGRFGLGIERDMHFDPKPLSWVKAGKESARYEMPKTVARIKRKTTKSWRSESSPTSIRGMR